MIRQLVLGVALAALCACDDGSSPKPEEAALTDNAAEDAAEVADDAMGDQCSGFVDGSNRKNSLAGIALGDTASSVAQQLTCGPISFNLEYSQNINGELKIRGRSGEEYIDVNLVGLSGKEKVVEVVRSGEYNDSLGPSVKKFVDNIYVKFPNSVEFPREYEPGRREFGFAYWRDGSLVKNIKDISDCGYSHTRFSVQHHDCGLSFIVWLERDHKRNSDLIDKYSATLSNEVAEFSSLESTKAELQILANKQRAAEVESAGGVEGF